LCGVGHIKVSTIISIIGAVVNIPFSVFFARNCGMGLSGIILGSLCVMGISFFILPVVTHKWLEERETSNT
jgi:Na+-driven multidrug efflux pump